MRNRTTRVGGWLQRLAQKLTTAEPLSHLATAHGRCSHCEHKTTWAVHVMSSFYRCRRCGHNPLDDGCRAPKA